MRAATAVCLRWGSYFALLADPARPPAPAIDNKQVSRIDDDEIGRMNQWFSPRRSVPIG